MAISVFRGRVVETNLMERSPQTADMMNLRSLVEKSAAADLLREMIGFATERMMALEVGRALVLALARRARCGSLNATATVTDTLR